MATAKKTGIVGKVKNAITDFFSDDTKRKSLGRLGAAKKAVTKGATGVKKAGKKVTTPTTKTPAKKVAPARKAATKTGASMDRKLIALKEPYEVRDWCKSLGCTEAELKAAVAAVGHSAVKVRAYLKK
jgi:hypothetical protein